MGSTFLFVSAQYLPTSGGVERYTWNLGRQLIQRGHRVIVATSALSGLPSHEMGADQIEIFRFPSWAFLRGRLPLLKFCPDFFRLARQLWSQPIDYCVINTYFYPLSMYAARQAHTCKIPCLIINHGSAWLMTGSLPLVLAGKLYERCAVRLCRRYCPHFYGVSQAAAQWLKTFSVRAEGIITNAISIEEIHQSISSTDWRQKLNLPADALIIAFVGRMIPEKGVQPLMDAMEQIRKHHPSAQLVMAGAGPLYDAKKHCISPGVHLLGNQPYPDVLALLQQADLFCLPSRSEGFACTVLEAAALGCPVLTTPTGDSPQLLPDASYGILLDNMESQTIAEACIHALSDSQWRTLASQKARQRLQKNYSWDTAIAQLYHAFAIEE